MNICRVSKEDLEELKSVAYDSLFDAVDAPLEEKERLILHIFADIESEVSSYESIFIKWVDNDIKGYLLLKERWNLCHLFVRPDDFRRGIGSQLLKFTIEDLKAGENKGYMCLNSSLNAYGFYLKMGFENDSTRPPKSDTSVPMIYRFP